MAKPNRGKTKTIKERSIYVYLPSEEMVGEWKALAEKSGVSISKFVIEHVENSLQQEKDSSYLSRADLTKKIRELEGELSKLRDENRMLRLVAEKLDTELKHYRTKPFLEEEFEGIRGYEKELIQAFKKQRAIGYDELLGILGIDPKDTQLVKGVSRQVERLEKYGLIKPLSRGWEWAE